MKISTIISIANEIRSACDCSDPCAMCTEFDIIKLLYPMGTARKSVKGFILKHEERVAITINSDLSEEMKRVVLFHELSHYILHVRTGLMEAIQDCDVYDAASEAEYEANLLSAELELSDQETLNALREEGDFYRAAGMLRVPPELLDFKLRLLREKGYRIPQAPLSAEGSYLRRFSEGAGA